MLRINHRLENNIHIFTIDGEVKQDAIEDIVTEIKTRITPEKLRGVVINFEKMTEIDSPGIGMLMQLFKEFQEQQIKLAFCHLNDSLCEFFSMSLIDRIVSIHSSEAEALASFDTP